MTRHEAKQLTAILAHLEKVRRSHLQAMARLIVMLDLVERDHDTEDMVNTSLEQAKGVVDDNENKPIRKARH